MPIQDYTIYTGKGYAGDRYDSAPSVTQSGLVESVTLGFGVAVQPGTRSLESGATQGVLPGAIGGNAWGISMRELNHEADNRPSDGTTSYKQFETASIMREGFILVKVTGPCTPNTLQFVDPVTGAITGDAVVGASVASVNITALEHGQAEDVVKVRIDIIHD